ncbi:MAG: glutamate--tRNA ligase [Oligoflexia bacterium]|nr:glutamate--tRNA ligase [Oligoflexia bacterium]
MTSLDIKSILSKEAGPHPTETRVRFAPSPTGYLHVGGARTHLFNWLYARKTKGKLILRVEDTDQVRSTRESEEMVLKDIASLDLNPDEGPGFGGDYGPYRQSERQEIFQMLAVSLLAKKKAYRCFCTEEELDSKAKAAKAANKPPHYDGTCTHISEEQSQKRAEAGEKFSIRMTAPQKDYHFEDALRGTVTFKPGMVGDFVVLRSNGMPVYNFSVVVDDYFMRITHVIRGDDHLSNMIRQLMITEAFGWKIPKFAHISMILGMDKKKLSKREGASSVHDYLNAGFLPEALINFLALLGWSPSDGKEIRPLDEIVNDFDLERLNKSPAVFDDEKLLWMNGEYIRAMSTEDLLPRVLPFLEKSGYNVATKPKEWLLKVLAAVQGNLKVLADINAHVDIFFDTKFTFEQDAKTMMQASEAKKVVQVFRQEIEKIGEIQSESDLQKVQTAVKEQTGTKGKNLFMPMRAAVTGKLHGPELKFVMPLIGQKETLRRIDLSLDL